MRGTCRNAKEGKIVLDYGFTFIVTKYADRYNARLQAGHLYAYSYQSG